MEPIVPSSEGLVVYTQDQLGEEEVDQSLPVEQTLVHLSLTSWRQVINDRETLDLDLIEKEMFNILTNRETGSVYWIRIDDKLLGYPAMFECRADVEALRHPRGWMMNGGGLNSGAIVFCSNDGLSVLFFADPEASRQKNYVADDGLHVVVSPDQDKSGVDLNFDDQHLLFPDVALLIKGER